MKRLKYNIFACCSLCAFVACDSDLDKQIFREADIVSSEVSGIEDSYVLLEENQGVEIDTISWTKAEFGFSAAITYTLEVDLAGNSFSNKQTVLASSVNKATVSVKNLNTVILRLDSLYHVLDTTYIPYKEIPHDVEFRLVASIGTTAPAAYSKVITSLITPYYVEPVIVKAPLYVTGSFISGIPSWSNDVNAIGNGLQVLFSDDSGSDKIYTYTALFNGGGEGKFPIQAGNWDTGYAYENGALSPGNVGGNAPGVAVDGYYTMTVNVEDLSLTYTPYEGETSVTYSTIGLIGDATEGGWDTDTPLTEVSPHIWVGKEVELGLGAIKFRADAAWEVNWGYSENKEVPYGIGKKGGDDILIRKAGTYYVALNDLTGHYIVILKSELP